MVSEVYNVDCLEYMKTLPDKYFSLSIADPPYGIGATKMNLGNGKRKVYRGEQNWDDSAPDKDFFDELFRVSEDVILWGANHYISKIPYDSSCWIVWDKGTGANSFADCELAWTSFAKPVRKFFKSWVGSNAKEKTDLDRIHPTQKPVSLYGWILNNYAERGARIFDPMMGSQSSRIAAYKMGYDYYGCELDKGYFDSGNERFERECMGITKLNNGDSVRQMTLFQ